MRCVDALELQIQTSVRIGFQLADRSRFEREVMANAVTRTSRLLPSLCARRKFSRSRTDFFRSITAVNSRSAVGSPRRSEDQLQEVRRLQADHVVLAIRSRSVFGSALSDSVLLIDAFVLPIFSASVFWSEKTFVEETLPRDRIIEDRLAFVVVVRAIRDRVELLRRVIRAERGVDGFIAVDARRAEPALPVDHHELAGKLGDVTLIGSICPSRFSVRAVSCRLDSRTRAG